VCVCVCVCVCVFVCVCEDNRKETAEAPGGASRGGGLGSHLNSSICAAHEPAVVRDQHHTHTHTHTHTGYTHTNTNTHTGYTRTHAHTHKHSTHKRSEEARRGQEESA